MDHPLRTLFAEQYAPITSQIGYVEYPFEDTVELLAGWIRGLGRSVEVTDVSSDGFPYAFHRLEPLTIPGHPRELLVEMGTWTAYFDNGLYGPDPTGPVGVMCRIAQVRGLMIGTVPEFGRRMGAAKWELFAPHPTAFLNYQRTIAVVHDSSRWVFEAFGEPQPFEDLERYRARRVRDRFDSHLVEAYSRAIGLDVFDPAAYGPRIAVVESHHPDVAPARLIVKSLYEVQADLGIMPGRAEQLPG